MTLCHKDSIDLTILGPTRSIDTYDIEEVSDAILVTITNSMSRFWAKLEKTCKSEEISEEVSSGIIATILSVFWAKLVRMVSLRKFQII